MVVGAGVRDPEADRHLVVEALAEVLADREGQLVGGGLELGQQRLVGAAVVVGDDRLQRGTVVAVEARQLDPDAGRGSLA